MIPLSNDSLLAYLKEKNLQPELQKETNQVYIVLKFQGKEFPLFFRIFEGGNLLQLLAFIPATVKKAACSDTARLLHYLNKELDMPGFGMDENAGLLYYRLMVPIANQSIDTTILDSLLQSTETITQTFSPVVATIAAGLSTFDQVVKLVKEHSQKKK